MAEVKVTPFGEIICGRCGHVLVCEESGDMPTICPDCQVSLSYVPLNPVPHSKTNVKAKEAHLAEFIALNWHHCPIDENVSVPNCTCWAVDSEHCQKCLLENTQHIKLKEA